MSQEQLTVTNFESSIKKVQARKTKSNFFVFSFGYEAKLVLPHKEGSIFMDMLMSAEMLCEPYQDKHRILPLERGKITVTQMPQQEYEQFKVAALLGLDVKEVKESMTCIEP